MLISDLGRLGDRFTASEMSVDQALGQLTVLVDRYRRLIELSQRTAVPRVGRDGTPLPNGLIRQSQGAPLSVEPQCEQVRVLELEPQSHREVSEG